MAQKIVVAELLVDLGIGKNDATKAAGELEDKLDKTTDKAGELKGKLTDLAKGLAAFATVVTGAALGLVKFVDSVTSAGDEIGKSAKQFGTSVTGLQRMTFAAGQSGAGLQTLSMALKNQAKFMRDAEITAVTPFTVALGEVGLTLQDLADLKTPEERFGLIGDALNEVEDAAEKVALAQKLVGEESGPRLVPFLEAGTEGLKAMGDEAERLGVVMSDDAVAASESFQDSMGRVKATMTGLKNTIGVALIPTVQKMVEGFTDWVQQNRELLKQRVPEFFDRVVAVAKKLLPILETLAEAFIAVVENVDTLIAIFAGAKLASAFSAAALGFKTMGFAASAALGPIGLIFQALAIGIPIALKAGEALGDILAKDETIRRVKKKDRGKGPRTGKPSALRVAITKENAVVRREDAILRKHVESGTEDSFGARQALERRNKAANRQEALEGKLAAQQDKEAAATAKEDAAFAIEQGLPDIALGPELPPGFVEAKDRKPKKAGKKEKEKPTPVSVDTVRDLLTAASGGDLKQLAARTPSADEIEPTVAVSIVNNMIEFKNTQHIEGGVSPQETADLSAKAVNKVLNDKFAQAAQSLQGNVVI